MAPHLAAIGITRIADITGLDRLDIPVFQAIVPRSRDVVSVYSGKGVTPVAARVSAIMEATERFCATQRHPIARIASVAELAENDPHRIGYLPPEDHLLTLHPDYAAESRLHWMQGIELNAGHPILVPAHAAAYARGTSGPSCYRFTSTNGLAAGSTVDEAVLHGLCEVIERDDWAFAEVLGNKLPKLRARLRGIDPNDPQVRGPGDQFPQIRIASLPDPPAELAGRFLANGLRLTLHRISDPKASVTTVLATSADAGSGGSGRHIGLGTSPDPLLAVVRSLTELAQSRAGDISATREDLTSADNASVQPWDRHIQRTQTNTTELPWDRTGADHPIDFAELAANAYTPTTVANSITAIVKQLGDQGLDRVITVDLSVAGIPAHVVRVIVPGLEAWGSQRSRVGRRLLASWNAAVGAIP